MVLPLPVRQVALVVVAVLVFSVPVLPALPVVLARRAALVLLGELVALVQTAALRSP